MIRPQLSRRDVLARGLAGLACLAVPGWAGAVTVEAAVAHVNGTIDDVVALLRSKQTRRETAKALRQIFEARAAVARLAQFCAGRHWRTMTETQKADYTEAFADYIAYVYAGYFGEFNGDVAQLRTAITIIDAVDAGAKGVLVQTEVRPENQAPVSLDWLVSDRSGRVAVSDLVIEGISLAVTQRETTAGMFEARNGDVALMIADMRREAGQ